MKRALVIFTLATARNPLRVRGFQVASLLPKTSSARLDCSHVAAYRASPHLSRSSFVSGSFTEQDFLSFPDRRPPHFIFHRVFTRFFHLISQLRKSFAKVALALIIAFSLVSNPALAVTGGRMGGSFGKSSSASMSRPMTRQPSPRSGSRGAPRVAIHNHNSRPRYRYRSTSMYGSFDDALLAPRCHRPVAARFSASDVVLLTGTSALIFYGATNNFRDKSDGDESALGPGASVASVTVALDVPSRKNPNSVLHRLKRISERANMASRKGVQDLVSEVSLELLRQEKAVSSGKTYSQHFSSVTPAERDFQRQSIQSRSKFDRESVNKFGSEDRSERSQGAPTSLSLSKDRSQATKAVVTLHLAIEGDSTLLPPVRTRTDLLLALKKIAADVVVSDCLLSAEVLWAPEEDWDMLTERDIYADYPDLISV